MPRARNSNTRVYKIRKDAVDMAVGHMIASYRYVDEAHTTIEFGVIGKHKFDVSDYETFRQNAIAEFNLTSVEVALAIEAFANYLSRSSEQN